MDRGRFSKPIPFDEGMLLVAPPNRLLAYNTTAYVIWDALAAGLTPAEAALSLVQAFGVDADRASAEVDAIIAHWNDERLFDSPPAALSDAPATPQVTATVVEWADTWCCTLGGRIVEFAIEDAQCARFVRTPLRPVEVAGARPETRLEICSAAGDTSTVTRDRRLVRADVSRVALKEAIHEALVSFLWPSRSLDTLLHGAAVSSGDRALCFAAPSGSGKSTLVAHLCGEGYQYLADDLTAIDTAGAVIPLPLPMSLKAGSWAELEGLLPALRSAPAIQVRDTQARLISPPRAWDARPTPLHALVFPRYAPASAATFQRVRPLDALARLREAGAWFGHPLTRERVERLGAWLERTPAYAMTYARAGDAIRFLHDMP